MPTFNQLVRQGRTDKVYKSKVPALQHGFNALTNEYVEMIENGIIDPTKVTRTALENAGSVASTLLTTEVLVCDIEEKIDTANPNAIPQGYGMY